MIDIYQLYGQSKNILLVGTYPPPLGGISVFIYRLKKQLESNHRKVTIYNTSLKSKLWGAKFLNFINTIIKGNYEVIHIQNFDLKKVIVLLLIKPFRHYQILFTDHNPFQFDKKGAPSLWLIKRLLPYIDCLMVVNSHILENYKAHTTKLPVKILISNAFIPPPIEEKERILSSYPDDLMRFLAKREPLIVANAYQIKYVDGIDLYGIDMCMELIKRIAAVYPNAGFIFCLADENSDARSYSKFQERIAQLAIDNYFLFLTGQKEIWPLFEKVQLFIRPTYRDGYGLSIDEALYFNCPAIASDACVRNAKAIIFRNRDIDDLYIKSIHVLKESCHGQHN